SSLARSGWMWMQLMQQSVQKSRMTTLPLRSFLSDSGPAELSHATPPSISGASTFFSAGSFSCAVFEAPLTRTTAPTGSPIPQSSPASTGQGKRPAAGGTTACGASAEVTGVGSLIDSLLGSAVVASSYGNRRRGAGEGRA